MQLRFHYSVLFVLLYGSYTEFMMLFSNTKSDHLEKVGKLNSMLHPVNSTY